MIFFPLLWWFSSSLRVIFAEVCSNFFLIFPSPQESLRWNLNFLNTECFVKFPSQVFKTYDKKRLLEKTTETPGHWCLQIDTSVSGRHWIKTAKLFTSNITLVSTSNNKDFWKSFIFFIPTSGQTFLLSSTKANFLFLYLFPMGQTLILFLKPISSLPRGKSPFDVNGSSNVTQNAGTRHRDETVNQTRKFNIHNLRFPSHDIQVREWKYIHIKEKTLVIFASFIINLFGRMASRQDGEDYRNLI